MRCKTKEANKSIQSYNMPRADAAHVEPDAWRWKAKEIKYRMVEG